jgi:GNAT superfamily N-acetyltransferase
MDQHSPPWTGEPITLKPISPGRDDASLEVLVAAYAETFAARTDAQVAAFRDSLRTHMSRPGFTAFCADSAGRTVGFAYGYTTSPHHQWHQDVRAALGTRANVWLTDCFALAELAVVPDVRRLGVGQALLDALLAAQSHRRAVLSTLDAPSPARVLYASTGWRVLAHDVRFPVSTERYVIMGRLLADN